MNFVVNTGNPQRDQEELGRYQQHYRAQGLEMYAQPLPSGGYQVTVAPAQQAAAPQYAAPPQQYGAPAAPQQQYGAPQQHYGAPQQHYGAAPQAPQQAYGAPQPAYGAPQQPYGAPHQPPAAPQQPYGAAAQAYGAPAQQPYGQPQAQPLGGPAYAMAGGGVMAGAAAKEAAPPLSNQRVVYLRKVYGLLSVAAFLAVFAGWATTTLGPTQTLTSPEGATVEVPLLVAIMLTSPIAMYGAFGVLFLGTLGASAVSKVRIINVVALMAVATLMGIELAPMAFVAQYYAGIGDTLSANPIRDTMVMVLCVFSGITGYIFVTRKDFSWMGSILSMGVMVIFGACILSFILKTEVFSLAVASAGALLSVGMLLYVTSYIFRNSEMDDAVGDALALLVQLRNLFMFLLRILMSSRR